MVQNAAISQTTVDPRFLTGEPELSYDKFLVIQPIINDNGFLVLSPPIVDNIYEGLKQGEVCDGKLLVCEKAVEDLHGEVLKSNRANREALSRLLVLQNLINKKSQELADKENEINKLKVSAVKERRFSVGPQVGFGFDGKVYGGVGVSYGIFRF